MAKHSLPAKSRLVLGAAGFALLVACGWLAASSLFGGKNDPAATYQFATVERGDIEDVVTATGTLQPRDYVDVGAQVSGQVQKIHVKVGDEVQIGDLLAEIDPTMFLSKVDATRAQLLNQRAQLKERDAQLTLARIQYQRQQNLMAEDATTKESVQQAEATLKSAEASLEALRAQIQQSRSTLRGDEANLQYARVLSPMTGTVVSITARQGQTLNTNQQAPVILRIADLSTMTVQTQVSEADIGRLAVGMEAYFTTLGGQNKRWYSALTQIEPTPTITNNVVLYNALFDILNEDGRLMTDMTAQVFFIVSQAKDVLQIPIGAIQRSGRGANGGDRKSGAGRGGPPSDKESGATPAASDTAASDKPAQRSRKATVMVLNKNNVLEERGIEIGVTNRIYAQVLSGLVAGEKVVSGLVDKNATAPAPQGANSRRMPGPRI